MVGTKIAVIGVGGWGKNHARVLKELDCLAAICDLDAARAKEIVPCRRCKKDDGARRKRIC
jgi:predicted dehydrogenase